MLSNPKGLKDVIMLLVLMLLIVLAILFFLNIRYLIILLTFISIIDLILFRLHFNGFERFHPFRIFIFIKPFSFTVLKYALRNNQRPLNSQKCSLKLLSFIYLQFGHQDKTKVLIRWNS